MQKIKQRIVNNILLRSWAIWKSKKHDLVFKGAKYDKEDSKFFLNLSIFLSNKKSIIYQFW